MALKGIIKIVIEAKEMDTWAESGHFKAVCHDTNRKNSLQF